MNCPRRQLMWHLDKAARGFTHTNTTSLRRTSDNLHYIPLHHTCTKHVITKTLESSHKTPHKHYNLDEILYQDMHQSVNLHLAFIHKTIELQVFEIRINWSCFLLGSASHKLRRYNLTKTCLMLRFFPFFSRLTAPQVDRKW